MSVLSRMIFTTAVAATVVFGDSVDGNLMKSDAQEHSRQLNWYYYWKHGSDSDSDSGRYYGGVGDSSSSDSSDSSDDKVYDYKYGNRGYKWGLCNYWWSKWLRCCQVQSESSEESSSEEDPKDFYTKRLNCGADGEEDRDGSYRYTDTYGNEWVSDYGYSNSDEIEYGGDDLEIYDTDDDEIYRSSRFIRGDKDLVYTFNDVHNGVYKIKLRFAEIFFNSPGDRTFDISVNDKELEMDVDILDSVGKNTALDLTYYDIEVRYNTIELRLGKGANDPKVCGIEVYQTDDLH